MKHGQAGSGAASEANSMMFNASLLGIDGVVDALEAIYRKWETR